MKLSGTYLYSEKEFDHLGDEVDIRAGDELITETSYRDIGFAGYVEYGLTDRLTIVGTLPFKILTSKRTELGTFGGPTEAVEVVTGGLSDLNLSARYPLVKGPLPVAVQAGAKVPLGYDRTPGDEGAPLGSGKIDVEAHLLAGASLYPFPGYLTGGAGYRLRGGNLSDQFVFSLEGGVTFPRFQVKAAIDGTYSADAPPELVDPAGGQTSSITRITDQDILKISPGVSFAVGRGAYLTAEAYYIVAGKNTVAGTTYSIGLVFQQ